MEKVIKDFEKILGKEFKNIEQLEEFLTKEFIQCLTEVEDGNVFTARDMLLDTLNIRELIGCSTNLDLNINLGSLYNPDDGWDIEIYKDYDYTKFVEAFKEDVETIKNFIVIKIQKYMEDNVCSCICAYNFVMYKYFKEDRPFKLDCGKENIKVKLELDKNLDEFIIISFEKFYKDIKEYRGRYILYKDRNNDGTLKLEIYFYKSDFKNILDRNLLSSAHFYNLLCKNILNCIKNNKENTMIEFNIPSYLSDDLVKIIRK